MFKIITKENLAKTPDRQVSFKPGTKLSEHFRVTEGGTSDNPQTIVEFIGTDDFKKAWYERQRFEIEAGREEEPQLWQPLYESVSSPDLPRNVPVEKLGPAGVIFDEIQEGGEVKFATVGQSAYSVPIKHYGVGVEYNKDLIIYNELWRLGIVERQAGIAFNALMNHLHLYPIISYSYAAANQTAANATSSVTRAELWLYTLEDAITNSLTDSTNPRRGPYDLLVSSSDLIPLEYALKRRMQDGLDVQSSVISKIQNIIAYDGWTGTRGKASTTYTGVSSGTGYLISKQYRGQDFQSFEKQALQENRGNPDVSRFILEQVVWDFYRGVYANPIASVEEITWPS